MATESYELKLTIGELKDAINAFTARERRDTANYFIDAIRKDSDLFDKYPGKVTPTGAELWVTDAQTEIRHHISLDTEGKGGVGYERVDKKGKVVFEAVDQRASEAIAEVLVNAGALILVED